jgi:Xaa-Pro aminopeptidase
MASRRDFIREIGAGVALATNASLALAQTAAKRSGSEALLVDNPHHPEPAPPGFDRLPLAWYQKQSARLRERAAARGVDAVVFGTDDNIVYFTGCFRGSGERSTWVVLPTAGSNANETVYWYSPGIDRDLIQSWWCTENEYYFCYPHAEGGFPNRGVLKRGNRIDLWEWMLQGLKKRGYDGKTIGLEGELVPSQAKTFARVLPNAKFVDISDLALRMRISKTKEEIALTQRAYRYFDRIHAFARDYILEHGTNATDYQIGQALAQFGINLLMNDVKRDGKPHSAVGIDVTGNYVRTGVATAYPHPNQFFHEKVQRGRPLYVNCDILLGGYGGECYRNYVVLPSTSGHDRMWQVVAETVEIMVESVKPGVLCSEVAWKVHEHQIRNGMQDFIYHRPGHGQGQNYEGHQPPSLALGDDTAIEEGMTFSVEPGLYDEKNGIGINPSDRLLVLKDRSVRMSRVPFSKEWSYLKI